MMQLHRTRMPLYPREAFLDEPKSQSCAWWSLVLIPPCPGLSRAASDGEGTFLLISRVVLLPGLARRSSLQATLRRTSRVSVPVGICIERYRSSY